MRRDPNRLMFREEDVGEPEVGGCFHPGQSSRLDTPQLLEIDADHEALFTAPRRLAWALLEAVRPDTNRQSVAA